MEEKTYTIKEIAEYISGWATGPFGSAEEIGKGVLLNALNQLEDSEDGIEAFLERKINYEKQINKC